MSPYHQIQVFLSKMALFVLTHDTVLTSSYVTLTDEEYLTMTAQCREMNKYVFMAMMEMHWIQKKNAIDIYNVFLISFVRDPIICFIHISTKRIYPFSTKTVD